MKIKYVIYHIRYEYSDEIGAMNVLSECESFDNEQEAEKEIVKYLSKGECYTIMKVYYK